MTFWTPRAIGEVTYPPRGGRPGVASSAMTQPGLVGRAAEREAVAGLLDALGAGRGALLAIEGEPGIGKSRLLAHLADAATERGSVVLRARASEFESDLPFALWTEALDDHVAGLGERKLSRLGLTDSAALSAVIPALAEPGGPPVPADRHRTHRALRDLLGRLAETRPLVLCLDDVHWADRASVDALAALVRRPADGPVLAAVAAREGQLAPSLAAALADALREERATRLALAPLSGAEAAELVGEAAAAIYPQSGGNPFYLEQLARVRGQARATAGISAEAFIPPAVSAAMATELAALAPPARRLLDSAAVAGDPFEPALAAEVAELPEPEALKALDELLGARWCARRARRAASPFATRWSVTPCTRRPRPAGASAPMPAPRTRWNAGRRAGRARVPRRARGASGRRGRHRAARRSGRRAAVPGPGRRRAVPGRRPATPARPAGGSGAAQRDAAPARRCPGRLGRPGGSSRDVAGGASDRGRRRAAGPDRRGRKHGVVAGPQRRSAAPAPGGARRIAGAAIGGSDPPPPCARPDRAV